ncbi:MAG: SMI1/KNR4 family protein [Verrucomicrobia bacterium]|nr:SMI1/KNR4 family protein [Verrucomicrobiota bacterium]
MNAHVQRFYRKYIDEEAPIRLYHEVIPLHETPGLKWDALTHLAPALPKGWYELAHLKVSDRIEFLRDFWLSTLPFVPHVHAFLQSYFDQLDDVGVYLTQLHFDSPFECEIVYSLKDGSCFYHGSPPCTLEAVEALNREFSDVLPPDYCAFLLIHDGFSKHTDTGMIRTRYLKEIYRQLRAELASLPEELQHQGRRVDPSELIPFYESFGKKAYQCFYSGMRSGDQVGNLYYSTQEKQVFALENLAFASFADWLVFYMEGVGG